MDIADQKALLKVLLPAWLSLIKFLLGIVNGYSVYSASEHIAPTNTSPPPPYPERVYTVTRMYLTMC